MSKSIFKQMFLVMIGFGLFMGVIFPIYANFFVQWIPELKVYFILGCLIAGLIVGVSNYYIVKVTVQRPLIEFLNRLQNLVNTDGDLNKRLILRRADEIGQISLEFNKLLDKVKDIMIHIADNQGVLGHSVKNLVDSSEDINRSAQNQMHLLEHTLGTVNHISEGFVENIAITEKMRSIAKDLFQKLGATRESISSFLKSMNTMTKYAQEIQEVTRQTNILSVNATIEAKRAGEVGKGFRVIAKRIQELEDKSRSAAELIEKSLHESRTIANQIHSMIQSLLPVIQESSGSMVQISDTTQKQKSEFEKIQQLMKKLTDISNKNLEIGRDIDSAAKDLSKQGLAFQKDINKFQF